MPRRRRPPLVRADMLRYSSGFDRISEALRQEADVRARWLREYLFAVSLIVRLPGGPGYSYDHKWPYLFCRNIWDGDPRSAVAVLENLLDRLGMPEMLDQIPRARSLTGFELPRHVRYRLKKLDAAKALESTIGCLDRLLIAPVHPHFARHRDGCVFNSLPAVRYDFSI